MKTQNDILDDVYGLLKLSPISTTYSCPIYKQTRPAGSLAKDCVFHTILGVNSKFYRMGVLTVRIYYPDINNGSTYYEDTITGELLEQALIDFSGVLVNKSGYHFEIESRETFTEAVEEIHQHCALLKIKFKTLN